MSTIIVSWLQYVLQFLEYIKFALDTWLIEVRRAQNVSTLAVHTRVILKYPVQFYCNEI